MAKTPREFDPMPRLMHSHPVRCNHIDIKGNQEQCGLLATQYYSYDTPMLTICPRHGVRELDTRAYGPTSRRHQQWLAAQYPEYARFLEKADEERMAEYGRVGKRRFEGVGNAI